MMYIDYYYKEIQPYAIIKGGRCYSMNPDNFAAVWQKGDYVPKVDFDTFNEQVEFNGDMKSLYLQAQQRDVISVIFWQNIRSMCLHAWLPTTAANH